MANPSTETNTLRARVTNLLNTLDREVPFTVSIIDGAGATDAERSEFFREYLGTDAAPTTDITFTELANAAVALRDLRDWVDANRVTLAKLRR